MGGAEGIVYRGGMGGANVRVGDIRGQTSTPPTFFE